MNASETIAAAIEKLQALTEASFTGPWEAFHTGVRGGDHSYVLSDHESILSVSANDGYDEEFRAPTADLVVTLHRTIDAQLAILRHEADRLASWFRTPAAIQEFTILTDMDGSSYEIPETVARGLGLPPRRAGVRRTHPLYLEAELNAAGIKTREPVPAEAKIVDLARAILGEVA